MSDSRIVGLASAARELTCDEQGQGLVEYALIILFIAVAAVAALTLFGAGVNGLLTTVTDAF